jgi:hypothetical protein
MEIVLNVAFVVAAVAFFKERLHLIGWQPIAAAAVVTVLVAFLPELTAMFPAVKPILDKVIFLIGLFIAAPGTFDFVADIRSRF